jgi:hypothetical protein
MKRIWTDPFHHEGQTELIGGVDWRSSEIINNYQREPINARLFVRRIWSSPSWVAWISRVIVSQVKPICWIEGSIGFVAKFSTESLPLQ